MDIGSAMFDELKKLLASIEVKFDYKAKQGETEDARKKADYYRMAKTKTDKFEYFKEFDEAAVVRAKIATNPAIITMYAKNPTLIPENLRGQMMEGYRAHYIETYIDDNPYYRLMSGHPLEGDYDYVYVEPDVCEQFNINPLTPVHQLTPTELLALNSIGYMDKMIEKYPSKRYLRYIGENAIDPDDARQTRNFAIIRINKNVNNFLYDQFVSIYAEAREYHVTVLYNKDFSTRFKHYDEFMALNILIMAIQRMFVGSYQNVVSRDFFDLLTIKNLLDCYQIPFIENLPLERQQLLVKNINKLLHQKSTNRVLYEICTLLGYDKLNIMQYYLVKKHRLDVKGDPVFYTKEVQNETTGEMETIPDYEKMYEIYFQPVDIKDRNPTLSFVDDSTRESYIDVVTKDPYWWNEDDELIEKLYAEDFNYIGTKYLSVNVMRRLSKMIFEVTYFLRMVIDKKPQSRYLTMTLPKLFGSEKISIFNVVVFLSALISKKNHMAGDILDTTTKHMTILGFNFKADFPKIREMIKTLPEYDDSLLSYISNLNLSKPTDLNMLYSNIHDLAKSIRKVLADTQDIKTYKAYRKLYKALLITDNTNTLFKMSDGTLAETFIEYLESEAPFLATYVNDNEDDPINRAIEHTINRINILVSELKYMSILSEENDTMINALLVLLRFFKSYTTDFTSFNIQYLMDDRGDQMVKVIGDIHSATSSLWVNDAITNEDDMFVSGQGHLEESLTITDSHTRMTKLFLSDKQLMSDKHKRWTSMLLEHDKLLLTKEESVIRSTIKEKETLPVTDSVSLETVYKPTEHIHMSHKIKDVGTTMHMDDSLNLEYMDNIILESKTQLRDSLTLRDKLVIFRS